MKYDVKMNIKRAMALYLATSVVASQPGVAAAAIQMRTTEEAAVVAPSEGEIFEVEVDLVEDATEEVEENSVDEFTPSVMSLDVPSAISEDVPSAISEDVPTVISAAYTLGDSTVVNQLLDIQVAATTVLSNPVPVVKHNSKLLYEGVDYDLDLSGVDLTTYGVKTVVVNGKINYSGSTTRTYTMYAKLGTGTLNLTQETTEGYNTNCFAYTGAVIQPTIENIKLNVFTVSPNDFTTVYSNTASTKVGSYTITTTGDTSKYTSGALTTTYKIQAANISGVEASSKTIADQDYTGVKLKPVPTLTWDTGDTSVGDNGIITLVYGTDFTTSYPDNVATTLGAANCVVTGTGNFTGTFTIPFNIVDTATDRLNSSSITVSTKTFHGTQLTSTDVAAVVKDNSSSTAVTLKEGTDYTSATVRLPSGLSLDDFLTAYKTAEGDTSKLSGDSKTAVDEGGLPGKNYVVVYGEGSYAGYVLSKEFIIQGQLASGTVKLYSDATTKDDTTEAYTYTYAGSTVDVKPAAIVLKIGDEEFTVTDDPDSTTADVLATYDGKLNKTRTTVTITFTALNTEALKGTITKTYSIQAADISDVSLVTLLGDIRDADGTTVTALPDATNAPNKLASFNYTGSLMKPTVSLELAAGNEALVVNTDFTRTYANSANIGEATITVVGIGNYTGTRTITFDIVNPNASGGDATSSLLKAENVADIAQMVNKGTACTATSVVKNAAGTTLTANSDYVVYQALNDGTVDVDALMAELVKEVNGETATFTTAMEDSLAAAGLPGENYYIVIGKSDAYKGSFCYKTFDVIGGLGSSTIQIFESATADATTDETVSSFTWDGTEKKPGKIVVDFFGTLKEYDSENATDGVYTVSYSNDLVTRGTVTITIAAAESAKYYQGSKTITYTIGARDISAATLAGTYVDADTATTPAVTRKDEDDVDYTVLAPVSYTGSKLKPVPVITDTYYDAETDTTKVQELVLGTDFTTSYGTNTDLGVEVGTVTITGAKNWSGSSVTYYFDIVAGGGLLTEASFNTIADQTYEGTRFTTDTVTPKVFNRNTSTQLTCGTDYDVYMIGSTTAINADDKSDELDALIAKLADGDEYDDLTDDEKAAMDAAGLPGENYYVAIGLDSYENSNAYKAFNILADLSKATYVLMDGTEEVEYYYAAEAGFTIDSDDLKVGYNLGTDDEYLLDSTEYTITKNTADGTSVTTGATLTVKCSTTGSCTGTGTVSYDIKGYPLYEAYTDADDQAVASNIVVSKIGENDDDVLYYTASQVGEAPDTVTFTYPDDTTKTLVANTDFTIAFKNNINVADGDASDPSKGPYYEITGKGLFSGTVRIPFSIALSEDVVATIDAISDQAFTGAFIEPKLTVKAALTSSKTVTLTENTDYTVAYSNNIKVGKATDAAAPTATITYIGTYEALNTVGDFTAASDLSKTFNITADMEDATVQVLDANSAIMFTPKFDYTGAAIEPTVKVYMNGVELTKNTADLTTDDANGAYTVSYKNNTDLGTATITVTAVEGMGYTGSIDTTFEISAKDISGYTFTGPTAAKAYTGDLVTLTTVESADGANDADMSVATTDTTPITLVEGVDYTLSYYNNIEPYTTTDFTDANPPTVVITGMGNYSGILTGNFLIEAGSDTSLLDDATITAIPKQTFTGYAVTPVPALVSVTNPATGRVTVLTQGVDYTIGTWADDATEATAGTDYTDNVMPGVATVHIKGIGKYAGSSVDTTFEIHANLASTDGSVSFTNSIQDASNALTGNYLWTGSDVGAVGALNFGLDADNVTVLYDLASSAALKDGDENYPVIFEYDTSSVAVGTVTGTFKVNADHEDAAFYNGTKSASFTIIARQLNKTDADTVNDATGELVTATITEQAFTGLTVKPSGTDVAVTYNGTALTEGTDYELSYGDTADTTNVGTGLAALETAVIHITGIGGYTGTVKTTFKILAASADDLLASAEFDEISTQTFTGDEVRPVPVLKTKIGDTMVDITSSFDIAYSDNKVPGTATITATGKTDGIYAGCTALTTTYSIVGDMSAADMTFTQNTTDGTLDIAVVFSGHSYLADGSAVSADDGDIITHTVDDDQYTITAGTFDLETNTLTITATPTTDNALYEKTAVGSYGIAIGSTTPAT